MMTIKPRRDVIEALIPHWDPENNVFRFTDYEMTPTLEEIAHFQGWGRNLRRQRPIVPKNVNEGKFLKLLNINYGQYEGLGGKWVKFELLFHLYGLKCNFERNVEKLKSKENKKTWKVHRRFAFMVAFLGRVVFPEREGRMDLHLAGVVEALTSEGDDYTLVPMILSYIFRALTRCKLGAQNFDGCNILLQIWFLEHFYRHPTITDFRELWPIHTYDHQKRIDECDLPEGIDAWKELLLTLSAKLITWNYNWFSSKEVICESAYHSYLVLIGLDGIQPYAPLRVMRQFARLQKVPPTRDMSKFCYDFGKDQPHDEEEIIKIWYASKVSELNEMVEDRDRGEVIPEYITWFNDPSSFGDRPEGSNRRRNDQRTIERLKEELEHAQMTIAKQQAQQQDRVAQIRLNIEKYYQFALRVMDKDLKHAKNKAARLEEELANTIGLVRRVEANKNAEIYKLQEDLSIIEEDAHQQQLEFDQ
ncbi:uncharacterized protein LOC142171452 [Nicotiana tabacum]|uniref:Uncharacterized protein LOC142171452 n=1 Tax=Nicotiana tabacum TaxID=4097 RepID=A0AC58SY68_TOBAC